MLSKDTITVTVLPDNRIRIETGDMSGALHTSAGRFLQALMQDLGVGTESRERIAHVHNHEHEHEHEHDGVKHSH
jgi:hypothetical protein